MNIRMVLSVLGRVLCIEAVLMLLPMTAGLCYGESPVPFLITILITALAGMALLLMKPKSGEMYAKEGFLCVGLSWITLSLFGALPFVFSGDIPRYTDAFFETVSGFTTTGASVLSDAEALSRGCMFWRLFTHWIGGMGVLVFIMAVLPMSGEHSMHIMRAEVPGPVVGKLVPRARKTSMILYSIYLGLTVLQTILLLCGGMGFYDALLHAFATAGTGGFSTRGLSVGAFDSAYIDIVICVFMLLFSINFNLYFLILLGKVKAALKSEELWWYIGVVVFAGVTIALNIAEAYGGFVNAMRYSFFQVASIISTTGFSTADFNLWPEYSRWLLVSLMFIGGCAGGTGGGMKVSRLLIMLKSALGEMVRLIRPHQVTRVTMDGRRLEDSTVRCASAFGLLYMLIVIAGTLLISLDGHDVLTNFTALIACISNVGPGLGLVGPMGNYDIFSDFSKWLMSVCMLIGRLEIYPILMLVNPALWKKR
ncbi:MAG: TrkH family potassium uptake protein [Oscillospiraceae bacterium]|nr:TrkH family potassium uptake protein [Oscillospiraceae bacterium]